MTKGIGATTIGLAAVLVFAVPLEAFPHGAPSSMRSQLGGSMSSQLGRPASGGKTLNQHRGFRHQPGFRGQHGFRQHHEVRQHGFRQHHGVRPPHHFDRHVHGGKRHHRGFKAFGVWPTIVVPPAVIYAPAPVYSPPPVYYWYCTDPAGYYPYVAYCPGGWIPVVPY